MYISIPALGDQRIGCRQGYANRSPVVDELARCFPGSSAQIVPDLRIFGLAPDWWLNCTAAQGQERKQHGTVGTRDTLDKLSRACIARRIDI